MVHRYFKLILLFTCLTCLLDLNAQDNYIDFNTIPKDGTILVYAHQDDDLIWMMPFWKKTETFIGGAMPNTPVFETIIQEQQDYLDSHGYDLDYLSNWITPWGSITHLQYQQYYWNNNSSYWYLAADHLTAFYGSGETTLVRTEINRIKAKLEQYIASPDVSRVITHNNWGEYGHIHHQAVNKAIRELAVKYGKDVWMLGCDNGRFNDISVPSGVRYTVAAFDDPNLFIAIRSIYEKYSCWTWSSVVVNDSHKYILVVDAGNDKSGYLTGESVTVTGPAQSEPGAYIFDGVDDYMTLWGNKNTSFTIAMRVRPDQLKAMDISKLAEYHSSALYDRNLIMNADGSVTASINDGTPKSVTSVSKLTAGEWAHIAMTGNGSNLKIYVNGILENTISTGSAITTYDSPELVLGMAAKTASFFKGQLNDVRMYDHALTDSEIGVLSGMYFSISAEAGPGGSISPSGSVLVNVATDKSFSITPYSNYQIDDVIVDGNSVGAVSNYTFTNVSSNHTITASFERVIHTINSTAGSNGSINPSGNVGVAHGDNQAFSISPDDGFNISSVNVDGNNIGTNSSYTFYNVTSNHSISATFVAKPTYQITSQTSAGGTVNPSGTKTYYESENKTYVFTPDYGFRIADVIVDGTSVGIISTYTFNNINSNHTISVVFEAIPVFTIQTSTSGSGSISPSGTISAFEGADTTFQIASVIGYKIQDVLVDDVSIGKVQTYTFQNIHSNHTIKAIFIAIPTYTINSGSTTGGSISPSGNFTVNEGSDKTYTITPENGYRIMSVTVDGSSVGKVTSYTFTNVIANHIIYATFEAIPQYSINASASQGGSINPTGSVYVLEGTNKTFTIAPETGFYIHDVLVNNSSMGAVNSYTFQNVIANQTIRANFSIYTYVITASAGAGGSISYPGQHSVNYNESITYYITPNTGYRISNVKVDNISVGVVTEYTFNNVKEPHTISVTFVPITFAIYANSSTGGSISPAGDVVVVYGSNQTFNINASQGYHVKNVYVDDISKGVITSFTFNNITADHEIMVEFEIDKYIISASAGTNGSITPSGSVSVDHGSDKTFTLNGNPGYEVSDLLVDNASAGAVTTYTFRNITTNHSISGSFKVAVYTVSSSSGQGGTISPLGTATFHYGDNTTYTITPNVGNQIKDVLVDNVSVGPLATYTFSNISASHTISVSFKLKTYIISSAYGAHGSISPSGNTVVNHGSDLTFTITSATGYHVSDVLVDNVSLGGISTYTFSNVTTNHTISASFEINSYVMSSTAGEGGHIIPSGENQINYGGSVYYTIEPDIGYTISDVLIDNISVGGLPTYSFINVTGSHVISAVFKPIILSILSSTGPNGVINPEGVTSLVYGSDYTYTINPDVGFAILDVIIDGTSVGAVSSYSFNDITSNHTISALFDTADFEIFITCGNGGIINPPGNQGLHFGDNITYNIIPDKGYIIDDVIVDSISVGSVESYTFGNITSNHSIYVSFALMTYNITAASGTGGTLSPGTMSLTYGEDVTYFFEPEEGYKIIDVIVDGVSQGSVSEFTFNDISDDHSISVTFGLIPNYHIISKAGRGGSILPLGTINLPEGSTQTYQIIPDVGFKVMEIIIDGHPVDSTYSYTFYNIDNHHDVKVSFTSEDVVVRLYPNPFKDEFSIFIEVYGDRVFDLNLSNLQEMVISEYSQIHSNVLTPIDPGTIPPGVYFIQLLYNGIAVKTIKTIRY
jgi:hypothetical protein